MEQSNFEVILAAHSLLVLSILVIRYWCKVQTGDLPQFANKGVYWSVCLRLFVKLHAHSEILENRIAHELFDTIQLMGKILHQLYMQPLVNPRT